MHAASNAAPEIATPNAARARWNILKQATRTSRTFRNGGKQRIKRLSKVMKARQNEPVGGGGNSMDGEVETVLDVAAAVSMHVDEKTGRGYSYNAATGQTQWLFDDEENHVTEITRRILFRKIVDDDNAVFFQNVETGETVWNMPKHGDLNE